MLHLPKSHRNVGHPLFNDAGSLIEVIGTVMDVTERKQAEQARQQLLEQLVAAQEEERVRIPRELHDSLGQSLTALHFGLKVVQERVNCPPDVAEAIQKLRELAMSIDDDLDRLTFELRPPVWYLGIRLARILSPGTHARSVSLSGE